MLKKLSNLQLMVILATLTVFVIIVYLRDNKKSNSTLKSHLIQVDTSLVSKVKIKPKDKEAYEFVKENQQWFLVLANGKQVAIQTKAIPNFLGNFSELKPVQLVANNESQWAAYQVDEAAAQLSLTDENGKSYELLVGKFSFNQKNNSMLNYVRLPEENEVYSISKPISFEMNKAANEWRNQTLIKLSKSEISGISKTGNEPFSMLKDSSTWLVDGIDLDSAAIEKYLDQIANLSSSNFYDEGNVEEVAQLEGSLKITTTTNSETIVLNIYKGSNQFYLNSSQNKEIYFKEDEIFMQKLIPRQLAEDEG